MTEKQLEDIGFYRTGAFINPIDKRNMDFGWFGIRVDNLSKLTTTELFYLVYEQGHKIGNKNGANGVRESIQDILKIED